MSRATHIVWIDTETNGLWMDADLLSIAMIVTTLDFDRVSHPYHAYVKQTPEESKLAFSRATSYDRQMHMTNGLWSKVLDDEARTLDVIDNDLLMMLHCIATDYNGEATFVMGGNALRLDQNMMESNLPNTFGMLDYHTFDTSVIKLFADTQYGIPAFGGYRGTHNALDDVEDAIEEAKYYRDMLEARHTH